MKFIGKDIVRRVIFSDPRGKMGHRTRGSYIQYLIYIYLLNKILYRKKKFNFYIYVYNFQVPSIYPF